MGHALPGQLLPGSQGPPGFPGAFPPHQQQVTAERRVKPRECGRFLTNPTFHVAPGAVDGNGPVISGGGQTRPAVALKLLVIPGFAALFS